jgi:hypothetical protein
LGARRCGVRAGERSTGPFAIAPSPGDIMQPGMNKVGIMAMTDAILKALDKSA